VCIFVFKICFSKKSFLLLQAKGSS